MKRLPRLLFASLAVVSLSVSMAAGAVGSASAAPAKNCNVSTPIDERDDLRRKDYGTCVTVAQGLLKNHGAFNATFTKTFGPATERGVRQVQRKAGIPETGVINQATWDVLARGSQATPQSETRNCDNIHYRTICVIKGNNGSAGKLYAIENGRVLKTFEIRTSDSRNPNSDPYKRTSEGRLKVISKPKTNDYPLFYDDLNNNVDNSNGQQAIRYSPVFAKCGYDGNLRGNTCVKDYRGAANGGVDLRSQSDAKWLQGWSNINTEIVILHDPNATV